MSFAEQYRSELIGVLEQLDMASVDAMIAEFARAREEGKTIFICGNGGSASSASHVVCDVVKGASFGKEKRFRMLSLNDNFPTLTAYSNDVGYDIVFVEQLKNFANPGDVVMAISGSGNSPNVVKALEWARSKGLRTLAMTGRDGGKLGELADVHLNVAHPHMGRIEDAHMTALHIIAYHFMQE